MKRKIFGIAGALAVLFASTLEKARLVLFANADMLEYDSYTVKIEGGPVTLP